MNIFNEFWLKQDRDTHRAGEMRNQLGVSTGCLSHQKVLYNIAMPFASYL